MSKTCKERRDVFYASAKKEQYRARSAYKLLQLDEYLNILEVETAVDLCAAPGSWSQVLAKRAQRVISVDLAEIAPIADNVILLKGDITAEETAIQVINLAGGKIDIVVCDGAPDVTGLHDLDEYVQAELVNAALQISLKLLKENGVFVSKIFRGELVPALLKEVAQYFAQVRIVKPAASRASSMEAFLVAQGRLIDTTKSGHIIWELETCGMDGLDSDKIYV